ncbi:MAG: hypothetical protein AAGD07_18675 [Planctomycetota bacterium]
MRLLQFFLIVVGGAALLAFAAAFMPSKWMVEIAEELGIVPFPDAPLTFYLARNLSLLYGFVGLAMLAMASDMSRYWPLIRLAGFGTLAFGLMQIAADTMAGLPSWWTWGEGLSTFIGGLILLALHRRAELQLAGNDQPNVP